jgi:hypothetical protein
VSVVCTVDEDAVVNFVPVKSDPDPSVAVVVVVGPASKSAGVVVGADALPAGAPVAGGGEEPPHAADTAINARTGVMKKRITHSYHGAPGSRAIKPA